MMLGTACGSVQTGEELFQRTQQIAGAPTCRTCHVVTADERPVVGPSLHSIASVATSRVPGLSAEDYLRQSIMAPDDYIVEGYQPGIMPWTYEQTLTQEQIDQLVAYLMTLE